MLFFLLFISKHPWGRWSLGRPQETKQWWETTPLCHWWKQRGGPSYSSLAFILQAIVKNITVGTAVILKLGPEPMTYNYNGQVLNLFKDQTTKGGQSFYMFAYSNTCMQTSSCSSIHELSCTLICISSSKTFGSFFMDIFFICSCFNTFFVYFTHIWIQNSLALMYISLFLSSLY